MFSSGGGKGKDCSCSSSGSAGTMTIEEDGTMGKFGYNTLLYNKIN